MEFCSNFILFPLKSQIEKRVLYLHVQICIKTFFNLSHLKSEKKIELNELSELEYWKTSSQMSSYAHWYPFFYLHAQTSIKTSIHFSDWKSEKKIELNELNEQEYSKAPSTMSNYTEKHVFSYLQAQTNINTLLYWSYTRS